MWENNSSRIKNYGLMSSANLNAIHFITSSIYLWIIYVFVWSNALLNNCSWLLLFWLYTPNEELNVSIFFSKHETWGDHHEIKSKYKTHVSRGSRWKILWNIFFRLTDRFCVFFYLCVLTWTKPSSSPGIISNYTDVSFQLGILMINVFFSRLGIVEVNNSTLELKQFRFQYKYVCVQANFPVQYLQIKDSSISLSQLNWKVVVLY